MISDILSNSIRHLFDNCSKIAQQDCLLCGARSGEALICTACHADLPRSTDPACPICAAAVEHSGPGHVCGACLQHPPAFDRSYAALRYSFPADELIQALKYQDQLALAEWFAELLHETVRQAPRPDVLIPMPLHPQRARERGFNQALEIARPLAQRLELPVDTTSLTRCRHTTPQATLPFEQHHKNIRGAFDSSDTIAGRHVALIDDVMTSGATLNEAARMLKRAGVAEISVWVAARAQPHH